MSFVPPPARKRLGQHFLVDPNIRRKIIEAAELRNEDTVFEIGPGRGVLTRALCEQAARVVAVEIDPQLCRYLRDTLADCTNLELHEGDALEWPLDRLPPRTVAVANLPYYVSTPLLFRLLEERRRFARAVLMLQTEVAERLVARPGSKNYGILSVLTQYAVDPRMVCHISPNSFRPRPDVGSTVVTFAVRPPSLTPAEERILTRVVRGAFAHRRKRMANSLRDEGWSTEAIRTVLAAMAPSVDRRAEQLALAEFVELAKRLTPACGPGEPSR